MTKDLIIVGASGFGREVAWLVERINEVNETWNILGFIDDNIEMHGKEVGGYPVLGGSNVVDLHTDAWYVCAIGSSKIRKKVIDKLGNVKFATLIDPSVLMSNRVQIGEGTIICAHTIITVDIMIGKHVIINLDCTIGHDAEIGDFVTLYPSVNVSGITQVGKCSELGTGTQIIQGKSIGDNVIVGAGAVVVKDIVEPGTYVGVPVKKVL